MRDVLGQEITVGAHVLWSGGKEQYGGFPDGPVKIVKITPKQVTIERKSGWSRRPSRSVDPSSVVVVDKLLVKS